MRLQTPTVISSVLFTVIWITRVQILLASITLSCPNALSVSAYGSLMPPAGRGRRHANTHTMPISGEKCLLGINGDGFPTQAGGGGGGFVNNHKTVY